MHHRHCHATNHGRRYSDSANVFYDKKKSLISERKRWRFTGIFGFPYVFVGSEIRRTREMIVNCSHIGVYGTKTRTALILFFLGWIIERVYRELSGAQWNVAHAGLRCQIKYGMKNAANRQQAIIESSRSDDRLSRARASYWSRWPKRLALEMRGWTHTTLHGTVYRVCVFGRWFREKR